MTLWDDGDGETARPSSPAPANGYTDSTTEAVRLALDAIDTDRPGGVVLPVAVLHTTLATGADHAELLDLLFTCICTSPVCGWSGWPDLTI